jgi:translation elongation factor EF-4
MGVHRQMVDNLVDPASFKLIHMAMQFHKGAQKVVTQQVNKAPKKIVKASTTSAQPNRDTGKIIDRNKAVAKMKKAGGNMEATQDAFLALLGGDK